MKQMYNNNNNNNNNMFISYSWYTIHIKGCNRATRCNKIINEKKKKKKLKIPSKWENLAHNGLICFFQHNYIPTFEQWLWDRVCVLSTWFGDICGSRRDFCMFYKRSGPHISNSIRCGCLRTDQCVPVPAKLHTQMHWQYWPSPLC